MPPSETFSGNPDGWWSWPGNQFDAEGRQKKYTAALAEMEKSLGMKIVTENHSVTRLLTAGVLHVLLPGGASPTILTFLTVFLVAQTAGSLSYVPGGSGGV